MLYSFTTVQINLATLTKNEYIIEFNRNIEFLKMFESSAGGSRAPALTSSQFTIPLPVRVNWSTKIEFKVKHCNDRSKSTVEKK
jgi:hypothetical protein